MAGLVPNNTYVFHVAASNKLGMSAFSPDVITATAPSMLICYTLFLYIFSSYFKSQSCVRISFAILESRIVQHVSWTVARAVRLFFFSYTSFLI